MADVAGGMLAFAAILRDEYGIPAGSREAADALRALEVTGVRDRDRVRCALRTVFCTKFEDLARFEKAFDAFFVGRTRLSRRPRARAATHGDEGATAAAMRREAQNEPARADAWMTLHARYSPTASEAQAPPVVSDAGLAEILADAARLIAALRLGRSRRWKPHLRGSRFDLRRTLRASLQTGGDPARIRTLGHPLRNPRIVVLLDGSRSMSQHAKALLQLAYALAQRSRRTRVFIFSTALREVTRELRAMLRTGERTLPELGEAWGGGTRLGASLQQFLREHGTYLDADTLVIVASDGLDAGGVPQLERAMRQIYRRCAGVVWLNPHAGEPGFVPAAAGMKAALPYISALLDAGDRQSMGAAVRHLRR